MIRNESDEVVTHCMYASIVFKGGVDLNTARFSTTGIK